MRVRPRIALSVNFCEKTSLMSFITSGDNCAEERNETAPWPLTVVTVSGLVDDRDRRQRRPVVKDVRAGGAVGLDQHLEFAGGASCPFGAG